MRITSLSQTDEAGNWPMKQLAPAPTAVQICPGAVGNLYSLMDQVKTVRAQTRALPGKLADHLDLAASFEILPDYGNAVSSIS